MIAFREPDADHTFDVLTSCFFSNFTGSVVLGHAQLGQFCWCWHRALRFRIFLCGRSLQGV